MSFFRQFASSALLAVFGTVSLLGDGLHLLSGCDHHHAPAHCCAAHAHCEHHHAAQSECAIGPADSDCPICQFLAIPQALTAPPAIVAGSVRLEPLIVAAPLEPALDIERPYAARAPPTASNA